MTGSGNVDQRYYASSYGRFNTADRLASSAMAGNPGSWNRYAPLSRAFRRFCGAISNKLVDLYHWLWSDAPCAGWARGIGQSTNSAFFPDSIYGAY